MTSSIEFFFICFRCRLSTFEELLKKKVDLLKIYFVCLDFFFLREWVRTYIAIFKKVSDKSLPIFDRYGCAWICSHCISQWIHRLCIYLAAVPPRIWKCPGCQKLYSFLTWFNIRKPNHYNHFFFIMETCLLIL